MRKPLNPAVLGGFVVGAIVVLVAAVLAFGSGNIFAFRPRFVVFFPGSIQGLTAGAPLLFRGVEVGTVLEIQAIYEPNSKDFQIPVVIELHRDKIRGIEPPIRTREGQQRYILDVGLTAQLISQSFVTGQKAVAIDFKPGADRKLHGGELPYAEVPAIESPLDRFSEKLENFPLDEITQLLRETMEGVSKVVTDPAIRDSLQQGAGMLKEWRELGATWNQRSITISSDTQELVRDLKEKVHAVEIDQISADLEAVAKRADKVMADIDRLTQPGAPLEQSLREFAGAARELRGLLEYLGRHPEALVNGRSGAK